MESKKGRIFRIPKNTLETCTKQNWPGFSQAHLAHEYVEFSDDSQNTGIHPEPSYDFCTSCSLDGYMIYASQLTNWKHHSALCHTAAELGEASWTCANLQPPRSGPTEITSVKDFILVLQICLNYWLFFIRKINYHEHMALKPETWEKQLKEDIWECCISTTGSHNHINIYGPLSIVLS